MNPARAPALAALAGVGAVTAVWWAFALWPLPADAPAWLERARVVCFGSTASGLPTPSGWMALFLQPATMAVLLAAIWGRDLRAALAAARRSWAGRAALGTLAAASVGLLGLAAWRVADASASAGPAPAGDAVRLEGAAPELKLTDQHGEPFDLAQLAGRPVLVVFAFAHCQTVCPLLVQQALAAQRTAGPGAAVVVVTLDPWRDTPARLPHLARQWGLGVDAWVLSGAVPEVEATLDAWGIARSRDRSSGDIVHATQIYVVDRAGRLAWAAPGDAVTLAEFLHAL